MPPRTSRPPFDELSRAFAAQAGALADSLAAADPHSPTNLPGWRVAEMTAHLAAGFGILIHSPATGRRATLDVEEWAAAVPAGAAVIDERARTEPATPVELLHSVAAATAVLTQLAPDDVLETRRGAMRADDVVITRCIEVVLHSLDLVEPPPLDAGCTRIVVRALLDVLAVRHPGRTVEVRVPPYAAVQCLEGPTHTRGTPPNTVECDGVTWLLLAGGRLSWAAAVDAGRVRPSGIRADLSPVLPLVS